MSSAATIASNAGTGMTGLIVAVDLRNEASWIVRRTNGLSIRFGRRNERQPGEGLVRVLQPGCTIPICDYGEPSGLDGLLPRRLERTHGDAAH